MLLVLGVSLGAWVVMRMRAQDRLRQGPAYRRLSRALGLGRRDRTLVWLVAREAQLVEEPTAVVVVPRDAALARVVQAAG